MALRRHCCRSHCWPSWRYISSSAVQDNNAVPILWKSNAIDPDDAVTVQLLSWGRGASGQLGGRIEEVRLYPAPVASLLLSPSFRLSFAIPGRLPPTPSSHNNNSTSQAGAEVSISCGLFHSALLADGKCWIWGKGDGGRLGLGHENPAFVPTLNPNLDCLRSIALGGLHSVALNSLGQVFTWSVQLTNPSTSIPTTISTFFSLSRTPMYACKYGT